MKEILCSFAGVLRASGIPVSTAEVLDCMQALAWVNPYQRTVFKSVVQSHFIKSRKHFERFEHCFELFFDQADPDAALATYQQKETDPLQEFLEQERLQAEQITSSERLAQDPVEAEVIRFLQEGDQSILNRIQQIQEGSGMTGGQGGKPTPFNGIQAVARRIRVMQGIDNVSDLIKQFFKTQIKQEQSIEVLENLYRQRRVAANRLNLLNDLLSGTTNRRVFQNRVYRQPLVNAEETRAKSLFSLDRAEREQLLLLMKILIRRINTESSLRQRRHKSGRLNVKRTFRDSIHFDGVPFRLHYQNQVKRKGDLVVLCDVSGSVYSMAQLMLALIYSISVQFKQVRSFAFADGLAEITDFFVDKDLDEAIQLSMNLESVQGSTNYGLAFKQFKESHLSLVGRRTTVLVFGDARNNGNLTEHHILAEMQRRARRVIWLNPESAATWNSGDSETSTYLPYCSEFRECRSYNQLEDFILNLSGM